METETHRKYCNIVKKTILRDATILTKKEPKSITLLDIACGRGGDIFKWNDLGIGKVLAFDVDPESVREAITRYTSAKKYIRTYIRFYQSSAFSGKFIRHTILRGNTVDIVSCMFAMHYFAENKKSLSIFLRNVSESLSPNGIFIGIAPDPLYVSKFIDGSLTHNSVTISQGPLPNSYNFSINDPSNTDYFAFKGVSTEFLINKEELETIAKSFNLHPITPNDILQTNFPNIYDNYPPHNLKTSTISQLYFSFCFVKTEN